PLYFIFPEKAIWKNPRHRRKPNGCKPDGRKPDSLPPASVVVFPAKDQQAIPGGEDSWPFGKTIILPGRRIARTKRFFFLKSNWDKVAPIQSSSVPGRLRVARKTA